MFAVVALATSLVSLLDLRPGGRIREGMVGDLSLDGEQGFRVIFPRFPRVNALFADAQHVVELESNGRVELPASVCDKSFRCPIAPDGGSEHSQEVPLGLGL